MGHAIHNDFKALQYIHPKSLTRDTSHIPLLNRKADCPENATMSLKSLTKKLLNRDIQVASPQRLPDPWLGRERLTWCLSPGSDTQIPLTVERSRGRCSDGKNFGQRGPSLLRHNSSCFLLPRVFPRVLGKGKKPKSGTKTLSKKNGKQVVVVASLTIKWLQGPLSISYVWQSKRGWSAWHESIDMSYID